MGKVEPHKRNVPYVTGTTEDWLWFQLAMVRLNDALLLASLGLITTVTSLAVD